MAVSLKFPKSLLLLSLLLYCPHSHSAVVTSQDIPSDIPTPKPCPLGCAPEVPGLKRGNSHSPRSTSTSTFAGVYYSPEDIANLRANAEARARESPTPVFPYFEAAEPNYWEDTDPSGPWGGASIEFLNLAAIPSPTDVTNVEASNEQVEEVEAPEEDNMIYYTEFKEFFSGLKGFSSEFTDAAKYKTAVKEGIPLPGLTTPSPYMTLAPKAKREVEESENINVKSMDTMDFEKRHMMPDMGSKASGFKDHPNPLFKQTSSLPSCGDPGQRYEMVHYHCHRDAKCSCEMLCPIQKDANSGVYRKFLPCGQQCYNPRTHVCNNKQIGPKMPYKRRDMSSGVVEESENSNVESMDTMAFEKRDAKSYTKDPAGKLCRGQPYNTEQYHCTRNAKCSCDMLCPIKKGNKFLPCGENCYDQTTQVCINKQIRPKMLHKRQDMSSGAPPALETSDPIVQRVCEHVLEGIVLPKISPLSANYIGQVNHEKMLDLNKRSTEEETRETLLEADLDYWNSLFDRFQSAYGVPKEIRRQLKFDIDPQDVNDGEE